MANTTNYNWETPDDTDLVKDGAAAIRTLGSSIDSTVFTNASNAINKTIVDAKADLIVGTAADTVERLAVGTNGQYLQADSTTATGLKWATIAAGGMTLLSTTTLSGASTTISSISQAYKHLLIVMYGVTNASTNGGTRIAPNGANNLCDYIGISQNGTSGNSDERFQFTYPSEVLRTDSNNTAQCMIYNYSNTTFFKSAIWSSSFVEPGASKYSSIGGGHYRSTSAITSLVFANYGGNFNSGTVLLYGVS